MSGALRIYDCMQPALRKGYLIPIKLFLKGALKGVNMLIGEYLNSNLLEIYQD